MRALLALALFGACIGTIEAADCSNPLPGWAQCGGRSNCNGDPNKCGDMQWKSYCCPSGYSCTRQGEWFWQCQPGNGVPSTPPPNNGGGGGGGGWTPPPPAPPSGPGAYKPDPPVPAKKIGSDWDWGQPLGLSFLFYEAQRSGKLPSNNRIAWRGDSGLDHKTNDGRDVTGGWYDAGDNVKFNFPMAWSAHVMVWSIVDFADGYYKAGQLGTALANVKWVTDYFIKCIGDGQKDIVVQVGSGSQDHGIWGRPEDIKNPVPVYTVNPGSPGSDVVAAMGATLGAASVAFSRADEAYSKQLLASAIKAYNFATQHIGKYSDSVSDAGAFYRSSNVYDDIAANAIWLYIATGQETYKKAAFDYYMKHYKEEDGPGVWDNFDWDSHSWAAVMLLQRYYPNDPILKARVTKFVRAWTEGVSDIVKFTPKGLAYSGPWGSLRHVGNAMFLLKAWAVGSPNADPAIKQQIDCTVRKQLGYILGDTGRSFVVGYGTNPPARPHHRSSSCPPLGVQCTWDYYNNPGPNPHTLYGALVGGPGANDDYTDDRNDYIKNEVATDYNAGFTGALAAAARGLLPCQASAAAGAPVFTTTMEPLPKMAIQVLPAPYLKQAMEVVSGERTDATPLPQPLPAIEAPKVIEQPAPKAPEQPVPAPVPAQVPVPAPAPKPFRPPQSLCFNWNDRTHQYEATTAEARDFLSALLGLKESSKSKAGLQGVIDVAARRVVKGPLGAHSVPVARKSALEPEHECVCPTHECAPCPAAAACPAHECAPCPAAAAFPAHKCAPCPSAAAAVKAAEPAPDKAADSTEPAPSKKKKALTKTKAEDKPPAKQVPATSDEEEPAPASAAPAPTAQTPAQQPSAPQAQDAQQQEEEQDKEQEEEEKQEEEEEEENQPSDPAAQAKPDQPSADPSPKAQQPEQKHQHKHQHKPEQQQKQPAPERQHAPAKHPEQQPAPTKEPEQKPAPAKQEQQPKEDPAPAQPEQQPAPATQERKPEQHPEQQTAPAEQEQKPAAANPEQQQPQPLQPQQPGTAAPVPQDPASPAADGAAEGQQKKKKRHKKKKAAASPAEQPAGAASPEEKQPVPSEGDSQNPAAANPAPEQQQQPAPETPAGPADAQQPPAAPADAEHPPAAPSKPHKKKKKKKTTTQPKEDAAEGSKQAAQQPSEIEPPAAGSDSADNEPSSGMTREKDLVDSSSSSSSGSKEATPAPASTDAPTAGADPAQTATPALADSPQKQEGSSTPAPDNGVAQNPDSSKVEKKKKKKKKARKALNEPDNYSTATPADGAATAAAAAVAVAAVPADAAAAATAAAAMLTATEV